ncbi:aspartate/glutamate racemase family protein [Propionimicrobium sp. PCR01-08-3]|uniref:aspartate/glutamate racemase family protein n=1 Tax=Propionimicrobium sp. PCR01-08-3 TaxID=3052086 RepID=UPI00255CD544|nr:aspartate/glutamate racemase family protein [Propionimicrobium sp. PCR01-08-3]WIY83204.1 aspartate/glutamate racemase family protein [Propionimicrobium sp. PCR01-08-3]
MGVAIIRVLTRNDQAFLDTHGEILRSTFGVDYVTRCIPGQPNGIHSDETFALAVPKIVDLGREMAALPGVTSVFVSCAADPGVPELREFLDIPVVGAGSAGAAVALASADKVGVLGITEEVPAVVRAMLGSRLVADLVPDGVHNTTDLMAPSGRASALRGAEQLKMRGASAILFACTGLTTIGLRPEVAERIGLPVIDAVLAGGSVLQHLEVFSRA